MQNLKEFHRIGGGTLVNLRLRQVEERIDPPGISVLRDGSPHAAASFMRSKFKAPVLLAKTNLVGSISESEIVEAGFAILADPSRTLPNHYRIIHPQGIAGFNDRNLLLLSLRFVDTNTEEIS